MNALKPALIAFATAAAGLATPAVADDHNDVFSCYAYVHEQCFPGGKDAGCGDAYGEALDECDGYYEETGRRPAPAASFTVKPDPQLKARIMRSFSKPK